MNNGLIAAGTAHALGLGPDPADCEFRVEDDFWMEEESEAESSRRRSVDRFIGVPERGSRSD